MIITPTAISRGNVIILIKIKAIIGSRITCEINPTMKSFGFFTTLVKSLTVSPSPRPNIMIAKHIGAIDFAISNFPPEKVDFIHKKNSK